LLPFFELAPRLYEQFGANAKLLANDDKVRLMRFEEADERSQERGFGRPRPKLVCPDSGQVEEPLSPPLLANRCRKRGKRERKGIIWSPRKQDLDE